MIHQLEYILRSHTNILAGQSSFQTYKHIGYLFSYNNMQLSTSYITTLFIAGSVRHIYEETPATLWLFYG